MRRLRLIIFTGVASAISVLLVDSFTGDLSQGKNQSNAENSALELTPIPVQLHKHEVLSSKSNQKTEELTIDQARNNADLLPHEVRIWNAWAESRGYDLNGNLTSSYNSMSNEVLLSLAAQNDPKAHYILAGRILSAQQTISAEKISDETIVNIESHLYSASVLGYTSTLNVLTELALRRADTENSINKEMIMSAYKFALTSLRRGDQNSENLLASLKLSAPLSDEDYAVVSKNSIDFYDELSKKREAIGLPPFDNETPPEISAFTMRTK